MYSGGYSQYSHPIYRTRYPTSKGYTGIYRRPPSYAPGVSKRYVYRGISKRGVQKVISQLAEQKYRDVIATTIQTSSYYTAGFSNLTVVPQGTRDTERIGDKLILNSLTYKFAVTPITNVLTSTARYYMHRLIIFKWYSDDIPAWSDLFQSSGIPYDQMVLSSLEHDKKIKRKILVDKTICSQMTQTNLQAVTTSENFPILFEGYIDLKRKKKRTREIAFRNGSTAASGHIFAGIIGAEFDAGGLNIWAITSTFTTQYTRVTFTDM